MKTIGLYDLLRKRALVTRESAAMVAEKLTAEEPSAEDVLVLDFEGIEAVTPSFVDEILALFNEFVGHTPSVRRRVQFRRVPTRLSEKFIAVGKRHGLRMEESQTGGSWEIFREHAEATR
jgi:hypothetical protein